MMSNAIPEAQAVPLPDDWMYGGADGQSPAADPRYRASSYRYRSASLEIVHQGSVAHNDGLAVRYAEYVESVYGEPIGFIEARRPGSSEFVPIWTKDGGYIGAADTEVTGAVPS